MLRTITKKEDYTWVWVMGGALALFASSQLYIPVKPVPFTFQTLTVLLMGLTYSPKKVWMTFSLWLGAGALGAPVFAGYSGGLTALMGPTGGYLAAMALAAYGMAWFRETFAVRAYLGYLLLSFAGDALVFLVGATWLSTFIGWEQAIACGVFPFLLWDGVKVVCAPIIVRLNQDQAWF